MQLSEYLDLLMEDYGIKNLDLANEMDFSPSYISKIRTGDRTPPLDSATFKSLYQALVNLVKRSEDEKLLSFLPSSYKDFVEIFVPRENLGEFAKKINSLMDAFKTNNGHLASYLDCDPSLISYFRQGKRSPEDKDKIWEIGGYFAKKALEEDRLYDLAEILDEDLAQEESFEDLQSLVFDFLYYDRAGNKFFEAMFETIDSRTQAPRDLADDGLPQVLCETLKGALKAHQGQAQAKGLEGLRDLSLTFFARILASDKPLEIMLFSNQTMDWMVEDPSYFRTWKMLMALVLQRGHRVQITHNLDRSGDEAYKAIEGWLPLHLYGNLDSYALDYPPDPVFANSLFIAKDHFYLEGSTIRGHEVGASFYLKDDEEGLARVQAGFKLLISRSSHILDADNFQTGGQALEASLDLIKDQARQDFFSMQKNLPLWLVPEDRLEEILVRNDIPQERQKRILAYLKKYKALIYDRLKTQKVWESFYLPLDLEGEDLALNIMDGEGKDFLRISGEDFLAILDQTLRVRRSHPNLKLTCLKRPIFPNVRFLKIGPRGFRIIGLVPPFAHIHYRPFELNLRIQTYLDQVMTSLAHEEDLKTLLERLKKGQV